MYKMEMWGGGDYWNTYFVLTKDSIITQYTLLQAYVNFYRDGSLNEYLEGKH